METPGVEGILSDEETVITLPHLEERLVERVHGFGAVAGFHAEHHADFG